MRLKRGQSMETPIREGMGVDELIAQKSVRLLNGCLVWKGRRTDKGYGLVDINNKATRVHRYVYEKNHGQVPARVMVLHSCDNPPCHEITHLFIGDATSNSADMVAKGRRRGISGYRLGEDVVREIRNLHQSGLTQRALADRFGITTQRIYNIVNFRTYADIA